jgi:hypothetical protein
MKTGILDALDVVRDNPGAAGIAALAGFTPCVGGFAIAHLYTPPAITIGWSLEFVKLCALGIVLLACMGFSVRTVWLWGEENWEDPWKSTFYVVAMEGLMIFTPPSLLWLAFVSLAALIAINTIAACTVLVSKRTPVIDVEVSDDPALELSLQKPAELTPGRRRGRPPTRRRDLAAETA